MDRNRTNRRAFLQSAAGAAVGMTVVSDKARSASEETIKQGSKSGIIRAGMIGCDTSHCPRFTQLLNDDNAPADRAGVRVVAAYPSFSADLSNSVGRVKDISKQLSEKWGVKMAGSIEEMLAQVDVVLLESVDGRRHLSELKPVAAAGKPVYIDKPFAASLLDAREMVKIIKGINLPCFSSSSLRYDSSFAKFMANEKARGKVFGCDAFSPAHQEPTNPGFFWYGIHGVEILYTIMGRGCRSVRCTSTDGGDLAVGKWSDGRLGSMRGLRKGWGAGDYGAMALCQKGFKYLKYSGDYYPNLVREIVKFFKTKKPPVAIEETLEICAFIDAAWRSSKQGGSEVKLDL
ncbi:MAG: Gfo/Idh/MocA family protein [Planctomycetota bacterium]